MSVELNKQQAEAVVSMLSSEGETITIVNCGEDKPGHSGPGLYAFMTDYPDEGAIFLGDFAQQVGANHG